MCLAEYHKYTIKAGSVDVGDKKWTKRQAEDLEKILSHLAMSIPSLVEMVTPAPYGDKKFNMSLGAGSNIKLDFPCGHSYMAAQMNWFQPKCEICGKAMERNVKADPALWHSEPINPPKPSLITKLTGKEKEVTP